jgi:hypothetical protein
MEVHKHPHDVSHKKKWSEYLLEFFMIFFAVFLGFLAENKRERFKEIKTENQYLSSLVRDLRVDTTNLHRRRKGFELANRMTDTLIRLLKSDERNLESCKIYNLARAIPIYYGATIPEDHTFQQLKSSGNLRLIHNSEIVDSMGSYYQRYTALNNGGPGQMLFQNRHDVFLFTPELFDMLAFDNMFSSDSLRNRFLDLDSCKGKYVLLSNDPVIINRICGRYFYLRMSATVIQDGWLPSMLGRAEFLLATIKRDYHLD